MSGGRQTPYNQGDLLSNFVPPCIGGRPTHVTVKGFRDGGSIYCMMCGYIIASQKQKAKSSSNKKKLNNPPKTRRLIERDGNVCHWCNITLRSPSPDYSDASWRTIEHLVPRVQGGGHELENLVLACRRCNTSRGGSVKEITRWNVRMTEEGHRCDNIVCQQVMG